MSIMHEQVWIPNVAEDKLWVYYGPQHETDHPDDMAAHVALTGVMQGWHMVAKWSRYPIFRVLYAIPGVRLPLLATELNDPKWSGRYDRITVEDEKLVIRTTRMAQWIGREKWRQQALHEVTGGAIVFEQIFIQEEESEEDENV